LSKKRSICAPQVHGQFFREFLLRLANLDGWNDAEDPKVSVLEREAIVRWKVSRRFRVSEFHLPKQAATIQPSRVANSSPEKKIEVTRTRNNMQLITL
jgi:hypothetical protein